MNRVERAFSIIHRRDYLPSEQRGKAFLDIPLPIGFGQTNSQPQVVASMLEWLDPQPGEKVLDVGSGSGWTSALLATIVGPKGRVYAVEIIPELLRFGEDNCAVAGISNIHFSLPDKIYGLPSHAPYHRILVSAAAQTLPKELIDQLRVGGKLVVPVQNDILEVTKTSKSEHSILTHSGYVFVPLVNISIAETKP